MAYFCTFLLAHTFIGLLKLIDADAWLFRVSTLLVGTRGVPAGWGSISFPFRGPLPSVLPASIGHLPPWYSCRLVLVSFDLLRRGVGQASRKAQGVVDVVESACALECGA